MNNNDVHSIRENQPEAISLNRTELVEFKEIATGPATLDEPTTNGGTHGCAHGNPYDSMEFYGILWNSIICSHP